MSLVLGPWLHACLLVLYYTPILYTHVYCTHMLTVVFPQSTVSSIWIVVSYLMLPRSAVAAITYHTFRGIIAKKNSKRGCDWMKKRLNAAKLERDSLKHFPSCRGRLGVRGVEGCT